METAILDTDVLSFIVKGDTRGSPYTPLLIGKRACISFQTVAEFRL